jgi:AbrB family looped-hinge helix DNA binding protein
MLTRVRAKGQITIPDTVRRAAHIEEGDYLEMSVQGDALVLRPRVVVPKAQAWFWTGQWQAGEREATEDIAAGRTSPSESDEAFLESLG